MTIPAWFDDLPVIGRQPPEAAAARLREVGEDEAAEHLHFNATHRIREGERATILGFLESDVFRGGLKLATTVQPAIGLTRAIASRNRNVPVQDFFMGLDFSTIATRARLAEGSYIAVQIPEKLQTVWDWSEWAYNPNNGQIVNKADATQLIPYNYIVFGVSRYEEK